MAQFDVYVLPDGLHVVDIQSDLIRTTGTRLVIPLIEIDEDAGVVDRLTPRLPLDNGDVLLATHLATAVLTRQLRTPIGSLAEHDYEIKIALDMLISGY